MRYAVIPFRGSAKSDSVEEAVLGVDESAYTAYAPNVYFVSFSGTAESLSKRVGFYKDESSPGAAGIVISIGDYFGFGNNDLWNWMIANK